MLTMQTLKCELASKLSSVKFFDTADITYRTNNIFLQKTLTYGAALYVKNKTRRKQSSVILI